MLKNRFFRKISHLRFEDIDQVKLVYLLSLLVGLLSALAAAILKNAIHYTHQLLTRGLTGESPGILYLVYPVTGMFLTLLFVKYIVRDNIGHGISRILYAISRRKSYLRAHNTWTSIVASSSTNGAGGVGGIFAPSLFIGGINGYLVSSLLSRLLNVDLPDNRFVLVGMAGTMAGIMHAPLTAIFLIAEITGGYDLLIPLIITATVAYITVRGFERHSIYHIELAKRGELITHDKDKAVLTVMDWRKDIETDLQTIRANDTLGNLVRIISRSKRNIFPVVDENNILEGIVTLDEVREIMFNNDMYDRVFIKDLMTIPPSYIDKKETIETVMDTFRKTGAWNLPVLDDGHYVGFISKSRIFTTYRELLVQFSEE